MKSEEIRQKFLDFFKERGHAIVPSSSLIPEDPSVLLTTAGMQQFVPYFIGILNPEKDFASRRVTSIQKAFRTVDIDEIGDETHLTFFEMLGHFSFGDYFKNETIEWTFEFLTKILEISKDRISATVFVGDDKISFDQESYDAWLRFLPKEKIKKGAKKDNVWGPVGTEGICGAANEVYVDDVEVATLVFVEYFCAKDGSLTLLSQKGVDVGWGLERVIMFSQSRKNIFETDLLFPLIDLIPKDFSISKKRISADHLRAISFLISDGVRPSNKEAGYVLRRLLRRLILLLKEGVDVKNIFNTICVKYKKFYPTLDYEIIKSVFEEESKKFEGSLEKGIIEIKKLDVIDARSAFKLYESHGIPFEVIKDSGGEKTKNLVREDFEKEFKKHQEISRAGAEKKFGGHGLLLNTGELKAENEEELKIVTQLHTATHLLQAALREVLGDEVKQMGSDITSERTRFDFSYSEKLTDEELKKVESWVNGKIEKKLPMNKIEMPIKDAKKTGALYFFKEKYPEKVNVYFVGKSLEEAVSKEFCGGPHVKNTSEIGHFKILKLESIGVSTKRIRAVVK